MDLDAIFKSCLNSNVKKLKLDGLEVEFNDPIQVEVPFMEGQPIKEPIGGELKPTAEQMLFWSSGNDIEIESKPPEI